MLINWQKQIGVALGISAVPLEWQTADVKTSITKSGEDLN